MRKFSGKRYIVYKDFLITLEEEINSKIKRSKFALLKDFLKNVRGVEIAGVRVSFSWGERERTEFSRILDALNEWAESRGEKLTIVIDEAQELIKLNGYSLLLSLAYAYDHLHHLNFIITGSEIRVFNKFLKLEEPRAPLYGRVVEKIVLEPFDKDTAIAFLKQGFKEHDIEFKNAEEVYQELGGNPGWLSYYGYIAVKHGFENAMTKTKEAAKKLLREEFENFINEGSRDREQYIRVIRACRNECRWSDVKFALETLKGRRINDRTVKIIIDNLIDYSFLIKSGDRYRVTEKLLVEALEA